MVCIIEKIKILTRRHLENKVEIKKNWKNTPSPNHHDVVNNQITQPEFDFFSRFLFSK